MKMRCLIAIFLILLLAGTSSNLFARTVRHNTIHATSRTDIAVTGFGSAIDIAYIDCILSEEGVFYINNNEMGEYTLTKNGKKLTLYLNEITMAGFEEDLLNWIEGKAAEKGVNIDSLIILTYHCDIPTTTISIESVPNLLEIKLNGKVHGKINGRFQTRAFSYKLRISFSPYFD